MSFFRCVSILWIYYWKFIAFQDGTLCVPLLLLFCLHPFFGLNAFLISGIKPSFSNLVRKYIEGKGPVADSLCGSTPWGRGLLLPLLDSQQVREQSRLLWFCLNLLTSGFWISTSKIWIRFFFTSQQPLRVAACYEGSGPEVYASDIIIQL